MARGVRRSVIQLIEDQKAKIAAAEATLKEQKLRLAELESKKHSSLLVKVEKVASERGISVEELLSSL